VIDAIRQGSRDAFDAVYDVIQATGAIDYTEQCAHKAASRAIESLALLPQSEYRFALEQLARFSVQRAY
jgi:octaprenyl-diphosphate synthase